MRSLLCNHAQHAVHWSPMHPRRGVSSQDANVLPQVWAAIERVGCGVAECLGGDVYTVW